MKRTIILFFGLIIFSNFSLKNTEYSDGKYKEIFSGDYTDALEFVEKHKELINRIYKKYDIDSKLILSTIFPERIRYSIVKDFFETSFLQTVYTDFGSETVDFSIGDFQMKPSFVEKLEKEIEKNTQLKTKYGFLLINGISDMKQIRAKRIERMQITAYQICYSCVFYDILSQKFNISEMTENERIKFTASAYNFGFNKTFKEISNNINSKYFPYGTSYKGEQYSYSDVAMDFYLSYADGFCR